jgi:hypothetical protein
MPALRGPAGCPPTFLSARKPPRNANFVTYSWFPPNHSLQQRGCASPSIALRVQECVPEFRTFGTVISALLITNKSLVRVRPRLARTALSRVESVLVNCLEKRLFCESMFLGAWRRSREKPFFFLLHLTSNNYESIFLGASPVKSFHFTPFGRKRLQTAAKAGEKTLPNGTEVYMLTMFF